MLTRSATQRRRTEQAVQARQRAADAPVSGAGVLLTNELYGPTPLAAPSSPLPGWPAVLSGWPTQGDRSGGARPGNGDAGMRPGRSGLRIPDLDP
jgi:hypothetical protein